MAAIIQQRAITVQIKRLSGLVLVEHFEKSRLMSNGVSNSWT